MFEKVKLQEILVEELNIKNKTDSFAFLVKIKRKKISDVMKINSIVEFVYETLKSLKFKKQENDQKNEEIIKMELLF